MKIWKKEQNYWNVFWRNDHYFRLFSKHVTISCQKKNNLNVTRNSNLSNLTPKGSKTPTGKNSKLRTILAVTPQRDLSEKRKMQKDVSARRFKWYKLVVFTFL